MNIAYITDRLKRFYEKYKVRSIRNSNEDEILSQLRAGLEKKIESFKATERLTESDFQLTVY